MSGGLILSGAILFGLAMLSALVLFYGVLVWMVLESVRMEDYGEALLALMFLLMTTGALLAMAGVMLE